MKTKNIVFFALMLIFASCGESKYENNIPYNEVSFLVYPMTDFNKALTAPGGIGVTTTCNFHGGASCGYSNQGIIVCRMMQSDSYAAYACTCPKDLTKLTIVNDAILKAKCSKCNNVFDLANGGISGNYRLLQYNIQVSAANQYFRVYN